MPFKKLTIKHSRDISLPHQEGILSMCVFNDGMMATGAKDG